GIDIDDGRRDLADQRSKRKLDLLITERNLALDLLAGRLIAAAATQQLRQRIPKARATIALSGRRTRSQHRDQYKTEKTLIHYTFASMFLTLVSHRNMYKRRKRSRPVFFHRFAPASPASVHFVPSSASVCRSGASRSSMALSYLTPILLLAISNIFMTFAWYGHLKFGGKPLIIVILVSWGIAFIEYCFAVPANRLGHSVYSAAELKTI